MDRLSRPPGDGRPAPFLWDKAPARRHEAGMFDFRLDHGVARLILNRPAARNAIPADQWRPLGALAASAVGEGARVLILEGEGTAFCAGADLGDFAGMHADPDAAAAFRLAMRDGIEAVAALPIPTIAAVDGACFGAGVALAMACDLRVAGERSNFAITPAKYGISYPQEDVARLVALVGAGQAARLLLGGVAIGAEEALRIGLADLPLSECGAFVEALGGNSASSFATLKRAIALAKAGAASDEAQDRRFDELIAGDELAAALEARRTVR